MKNIYQSINVYTKFNKGMYVYIFMYIQNSRELGEMGSKILKIVYF